MPTSEKQRKAAIAEMSRRMKGMEPEMFKGMSNQKLSEYVHEPLHKKKKKKGY